MKHGLVAEIQVVKHIGTAEATFDMITLKATGWTEEEYENEFYPTNTYEDRYDYINDYLRGTGKEIIWLSRVKVNTFG